MSEKKDKKKQIDQLADNQFHDDEQILSESEIDNAEDYLFGDRDSAVLRLSHQKNKTDMKEIIPLLKQDLLKYVTYHHKEFVGDIHTNVPVYELMKSLIMKLLFQDLGNMSLTWCVKTKLMNFKHASKIQFM